MELNNDQKLAFSFFKQHPLMTLSTISENGVPQNAVIYVYCDDALNCYFASRSNTRKFANLQKNPIATLSTYDKNLLMEGEVSGEANEISDPVEIEKVFPQLKSIIEDENSPNWIPPIEQLGGEGYVFYKLVTKEVKFINYEQSSSVQPHPHIVKFSL